MLRNTFTAWIPNSLQPLWQNIFGPRWFQLDDTFSRLTPLKGWDQDALRTTRLLVVGCGALGANLSLFAARYGLGEIWLADYDLVEASNLPRQPFFSYDIGRNKALALKDHALRARVDPATRIKAIPYRFEEAISAGLVPPPTHLFVGVDNDPSRRWVISYAVKLGIPAIITGLDGEAANGYVFAQKSEPNTPCPACFWPSLAESTRHGACAPVSAGITLTLVGISIAALESLVMKRSINWDVKTVALAGGSDGSYRVMKRSSCLLCASPELHSVG